MNEKWTLENLQKYCDERNCSCKVLSKEYIDKGYQNVLYVTLQLEDGRIKKVAWNSFKNKKNINSFSTKWTQEEAFNFCIKNNFFPIEEATFNGVDKTFPCKDENGFIYMISITNLKRHLKTNINFSKTKNNPYSVYNVKLFCKLFKPDYEFLENKISNTRNYYKFKYIGPLNKNIPRVFECSLDYFINGEGGLMGTGISKEANFIAGILRKEKINFSLEKTFEDLKSWKGCPLRYDFAIYDINNNLKCLIEYDSIIHFEHVPYFHKNITEFKKAQERDRKKNNYVLAHKIPLYRIPYWDLSSIRSVNDLFKDKYLVKTQYHNDILINERKGG